MPSNIVQHSFANRVRNLVATRPFGISDVAVASILGKPIGDVRKAVRNDQAMIATDSYIESYVDASGHEIYTPRADRVEFTHKPRKPAAKRAKTIRSDQFSAATLKRAITEGAVPLVINTIPTLAEISPPNPLTWSPAQRALFVEHEATQMFQAVQDATAARVEQTSQDLATAVWSRYNELMGEALSASLG